MSRPKARSIPERLLALREALGEPGEPLSKQQLAVRLGTTWWNIHRWEKGTRPIQAHLDRITALERQVAKATL